MRALPGEPVFDRAQARAGGWSASALTRAVTAGRIVRVRRGQFALPECLDARHAAIAAARDVRGSVVSHRSALLLHDLPVVGKRPAFTEITVAPAARGSAHAALLHRATLRCDDIVEVDGVAVTSVARSVIDVARSRPIATAVAAIDAALNRELVTEDELDEVVARCWNWPGIRRAQRALEKSDGRAESPLESVSRLVLGWLRLPPADLQPVVVDRYGVPAGRLDFYWEEFGVAGEADGRSKYDERDALVAEKDRQERMENDSMHFARWGWGDTIRPQRMRARVEAAFERGRLRDRAGIPRTWSVIKKPKRSSARRR